MHKTKILAIVFAGSALVTAPVSAQLLGGNAGGGLGGFFKVRMRRSVMARINAPAWVSRQ